MGGYGDEGGRPEPPFVGHCTFAKAPPAADWTAIDADIAVLGAPFDMAARYRAGARFGPRAIREASTLFAFGHDGAYDFEDDVVYLPRDEVTIVDIGDAGIVPADPAQSHDNIELGVRRILEAGALPVVLGGDRSVHIPCIRAFSDEDPVHVVHIGAHAAFADRPDGVPFGQDSALRRASEMAHVTGLTQLGIRDLASSGRRDFEAAREAGADILSVREARRLGADGVLRRIPGDARYYLTVDIGGFDPSIAPGAGAPSHGGFHYDEVLEILQGLAQQGEVAGIDLVEVAPDHDRSGITAMLAAQLLLCLLGHVFHERKLRG